MSNLFANTGRRTKVFYRDIDINFTPNWNRDISSKDNARAVMQAVVNIVTTKKGSMPFDPDYGTTIGSEMFENITPFLLSTIETDIKDAIIKYEPRVEDIEVSLTPITNDLHTIEVRIVFKTVYDDSKNELSFSVEA